MAMAPTMAQRAKVQHQDMDCNIDVEFESEECIAAMGEVDEEVQHTLL